MLRFVGMPRYTGIGMPKKRKRAVAEWSEAQGMQS